VLLLVVMVAAVRRLLLPLPLGSDDAYPRPDLSWPPNSAFLRIWTTGRGGWKISRPPFNLHSATWWVLSGWGGGFVERDENNLVFFCFLKKKDDHTERT